jgi:hypothetical protein
MIVGIHQPNFLPWIGYFHKIAKSDEFVLIDQVQYVKGSVCNRNKIKSSNGTELLLTVPVKLSKGAYQAFNEIGIDYTQKWQSKMLNLISAQYKKAPFFEEYFVTLSGILKQEYPNLAALNILLISKICEQLNISTPVHVASGLPVSFGKKNDMNLNIVRYLKGNIYLSGQGAKKYNDENLFAENGIVLEYIEFIHPSYPQLWGEFIPNLSVIDLLFNTGTDAQNYFK